MTSINSKIGLDIENELEFVKGVDSGLEDYSADQNPIENRLTLSNKQLVHKISMIPGDDIKTKSRKLNRIYLLGAIPFFLIAFAAGFLSYRDGGLWILLIAMIILFEIIATPIRNGENKLMVREHDRVIGVMREVGGEG